MAFPILEVAEGPTAETDLPAGRNGGLVELNVGVLTTMGVLEEAARSVILGAETDREVRGAGLGAAGVE
jgi:hypothetical protein